MLNSIKTLRRYCKVTLNVFFNKKIFDDDKSFYLYDRFFESNQNVTTVNVKIVKIPGFFSDFFSKFPKLQVFLGSQVKWQPCVFCKLQAFLILLKIN